MTIVTAKAMIIPYYCASLMLLLMCICVLTPGAGQVVVTAILLISCYLLCCPCVMCCCVDKDIKGMNVGHVVIEVPHMQIRASITFI